MGLLRPAEGIHQQGRLQLHGQAPRAQRRRSGTREGAPQGGHGLSPPKEHALPRPDGLPNRALFSLMGPKPADVYGLENRDSLMAGKSAGKIHRLWVPLNRLRPEANLRDSLWFRRFHPSIESSLKAPKQSFDSELYRRGIVVFPFYLSAIFDTPGRSRPETSIFRAESQ